MDRKQVRDSRSFPPFLLLFLNAPLSPSLPPSLQASPVASSSPKMRLSIQGDAPPGLSCRVWGRGGGRGEGREGGRGDPIIQSSKEDTRIRVPRVVLATGGFFLSPPPLAGILRPCFSYLAAVPPPPSRPPSRPTPNFLTSGFTHDWCVVGSGHVRVSGEDHFSALKPPRRKARARAVKMGCLSS
jgi:hypothetical protein